jgi:hypothetical protein
MIEVDDDVANSGNRVNSVKLLFLKDLVFP